MSEGDRKPIPLSNLWKGIYVTLPSLTIPLVFTEMTNPPEDDDSLTQTSEEPCVQEVDANEPNSEYTGEEHSNDENHEIVDDQLDDGYDNDNHYDQDEACDDDQPFAYDDYEYDYIYSDD